MRLAMLETPEGTRLVGLRDNSLVEVTQAGRELPMLVDDLVRSWDELKQPLQLALADGPLCNREITGYLPPICRPNKILCVGKNYAQHAREMGSEPPEEPLIFSKLGSTLIGHQAPVVLPRESDQVDYEAELVVVIGKPGRRIPESSAMDHVAGFTCGNDISARDWQKGKPGGQWLLGKSFDSFAPIGPFFVSADEIRDPQNLDVTLRLNGACMQQSNTRNMVHSIASLIAYISQVCSLESGDLLFTGTPEGVGAARQPPVFLRPGDFVEVEISQVGTLRNPVVARP